MPHNLPDALNGVNRKGFPYTKRAESVKRVLKTWLVYYIECEVMNKESAQR